MQACPEHIPLHLLIISFGSFSDAVFHPQPLMAWRDYKAHVDRRARYSTSGRHRFACSNTEHRPQGFTFLSLVVYGVSVGDSQRPIRQPWPQWKSCGLHRLFLSLISPRKLCLDYARCEALNPRGEYTCPTKGIGMKSLYGLIQRRLQSKS